jgi:hypothetical protein
MSLFAISILFIAILSGCSSKKESTTDVSKYGNFSTFQISSSLLVFPKTIPKSATVNGYYYSRIIPPFIGTYYQIYLNITLPEEEYKEEVDRLSKIVKGTKIQMYDNKPTSINIKYDKSNFIYPAYVAMRGYNGVNEYALLDEKEHKIIYVFTQIINKNDIKFNKKYLPKDYKNDGECNESFSIYDE